MLKCWCPGQRRLLSSTLYRIPYCSPLSFSDSFRSLHQTALRRHNMSIQQPPWHLPVPTTEQPVLKLYNSLTKSKTEFVPRNGKHVKWYNCGPTVYDASHMGHARNYVTQDILRRILTDYFGYDVHFVQNVTDIDDKIILRARQNHLVDVFRSQHSSLSEPLIKFLLEAWAYYASKKFAKGLDVSPDSPELLFDNWPQLYERIPQLKADGLKRDEKFEMHGSTLNRAHGAIVKARSTLASGQAGDAEIQRVIDESKSTLAEYLDYQFKENPTPLSPLIFRQLAAYWEQRFNEDMERLHVRPPSTVTRVTEYVPEVVAFVEQIIKNGYAYETGGSVYFDTSAFDGKGEHSYARLEPWSKGNCALIDEGEGALSAAPSSAIGTARQKSDFALWKGSKVGEPEWPSPWGAGRPGWHIECSVMASAILGQEMDIHSGGVDLAFPHHDNELAQSEAYHECPAWVNYFLHTGHLHIEGLKMSKSLKNFITIEEILQRFTARQLRLGFITQLWNAKVDFSEALMAGEVRGIETTFNNFFTTVKALVGQSRANGPQISDEHGFDEPEREITNALHQAQHAFRAALCDSFNTPDAIAILRDLVSRTNVYISTRGKKLNVDVVERTARWVGDMLRMFGLGEGESSEIGWGEVRETGESANREETLMPYLRAMSSFRDAVRAAAMGKSDTALKDILALCDKLRDSDLVPLGVALDDQEDGKALVKLVSPAELIRARDEKRAAAEAKAAKKAAQVEAERLKRVQKLEKGRIPPSELFKPPQVPEGTYGSWDDKGLPLTDNEGKELSKNQVKKVQKEWGVQQKLHEDFLRWQVSGGQ